MEAFEVLASMNIEIVSSIGGVVAAVIEGIKKKSKAAESIFGRLTTAPLAEHVGEVCKLLSRKASQETNMKVIDLLDSTGTRKMAPACMQLIVLATSDKAETSSAHKWDEMVYTVQYISTSLKRK